MSRSHVISRPYLYSNIILFISIHISNWMFIWIVNPTAKLKCLLFIWNSGLIRHPLYFISILSSLLSVNPTKLVTNERNPTENNLDQKEELMGSFSPLAEGQGALLGPPAQQGVALKHCQTSCYCSPLLFSEWASLPLRVSFFQTLWQNVSPTPPGNGYGKRKMVLRLWSIATPRPTRLTTGAISDHVFCKGTKKLILQGREEEISQRKRLKTAKTTNIHFK